MTLCSKSLLVALLALSASPALAQGGEAVKSTAPVSTLELGFDLFAGGVPLGKVAMTARLQGDDYKASSSLETKGIVNRFWHSKIDTSSTGQIGEGKVQPTTYDSFSVYRSTRRQQVVLSFDENGPASVYSDPPYQENLYPIPDEQKRKTLDPLSAVVFLTTSFRANEAKPCEVTAPVFDGRRRYDVAMSYVKNAEVKMDNGLYAGPALVCQIHYNQVAGYKQRIVADGRKLPDIYAWVATFTSKSDPTRKYVLPLRIWAETEYGIVVAMAQKVKLDGLDLGQPS